MKSLDKNMLLNYLESKTDDQLVVAIRDFQNLSEVELSKQPIQGGWSVAQCLDHLNSYGQYYLPRIREALVKKSKHTDDPFKSTWLGNYFIRMMDPDTGKRKLKAIKKHQPVVPVDVYTIVSAFIQQQEELILLINEARKANLNVRLSTSLSPFIRLKLGDALGFLSAHNERHLRQAAGILSEKNQ